MRTNLCAIAILVVILFGCENEHTIEGTTPKSEKPNVIVIYTDDQGTVDLNAYGSKDLLTPNMDKIVMSGVRFTQFYGAPVCSPSRVSLLTGKTPQAAGVWGNIPATPNQTKGLASEEYTMAEMFKDAGYNTAHIGKWHLGFSKDKQPNAQGFDYSFGHHVGCIDNYSHFYYWRGPNRHDLYRNGEEVFYDGQFFPDLMIDEAFDFMEKNTENPFFLYFAMNMPHYPYQGDEKWLNYYKDKGMESPRDLYAAFLSTQDDRVGQLMDKLESLGLKENTIIIFQSDNGHSTEERAFFGGGSAGIYRGAKSCLFEGGYRVPAAISWPGKLKGGEVRGQMSVCADWMPTLAELCDIDLDQTDLDGRSLLPVIKDPNAPSVHEDGFIWLHGNNQWAARKGKWKLLGNPVDKSNKAPLTDKDTLFLVDLEADPGEMTNLAAQYPDKVNELKAQFEAWLAETKAKNN